ncbi:hypothetical protein SOVF_057490 [Spinacia oleracea]|nr:hypothetical protein SOVF_057490 [Spinacia oleracea]
MSTATHKKPPTTVAASFFVAFSLLSLHSTEAQIGVCYGMLGTNLPSPQQVVNLYKSNGIKAMRLYEPNQPTLQALQGSNIKVMLGVANNDVQRVASDQIIANTWVQTNVLPYATSIKYVAVGNEIKSDGPLASSVKPAMQNILNALNKYNLGGSIKVSTSIDTGLIRNSNPPSNAEFSNLNYITPIINFLSTNDFPMLVNIQPYTAYKNNPGNITLDFLLFTSPGPVFTDPGNGLKYQNLFDALYDSVDAAVQKVCASHTNVGFGRDNWSKIVKRPVKIVSSESGHPSGGGFHHSPVDFSAGVSDGGGVTTVENAKTYYTKLINHVKGGSPLRPGVPIETYLFAMFDENEKQGDDTERCYGIFNTNGSPKIGPLNFN